MRTALVIDGDPRARRKAVDLLTERGFRVSVPGSLDEAWRLCEALPVELVVVEPEDRDAGGLELIARIREAGHPTTCVALTADPSAAGSTGARRQGADAYLAKPLTAHGLEEALASRSRPAAPTPVPPPRPGAGGGDGLVAGSGPMLRVLDRLRKVARLDTTVLLTGESGTGKELAARLLHEGHPRRKDGPLVCLHCGAIPHTLLESELFGHVRGAFTGAERDRIGKFEQANGGTLFLDEISTMSPEAQVRLLRVLQERCVTRIGATEARPIDVRVVVASNQDLRSLVDQGRFRLDLFYRVNTFPIAIPPLRERPGDVPALVEFLCARVVRKLELPVEKRFAPDALRALANHDWPGNVRELENAVEYALIVSDEREEVLPRDLPPEIAELDPDGAPLRGGPVVTEEGLNFRTAVTNLERELILQSLRLAEGNKARAAELLELKRTTFLEKLRRLEQDGLVPA